jgi:hypothetical protein
VLGCGISLNVTRERGAAGRRQGWQMGKVASDPSAPLRVNEGKESRSKREADPSRRGRDDMRGESQKRDGDLKVAAT